jgi:hypothetical protein
MPTFVRFTGLCHSPIKDLRHTIKGHRMAFCRGEIVRIGNNDLLRRGEKARVKLVLPETLSRPFTEYLVEFEQLPKTVHASSERFLLCRYREEELVKEE